MTASSAEILGVDGAATPTQLFVINLAASTSPMALSHPSSPELKRFTFFVSRQREEGRERFRLHMGYFDTQEDAEQLLESVRDVYPAAWAGPAPTTGMGRRGRIAPGSVATGSAPPALAVAPSVPATAVAAAVIPAAAPVAPAKPAVASGVAPLAPPAASATDATTIAPKLRAPVLQAPTEIPDLQLESMSNVRDVLAQLSEAPASNATVQMPLPAALKQQPPAPVAPKVTASVVKVAAAVEKAPADARPAAPAPRARELTGADALSLLEMPAAPAAPPVLSSVATTTRAPVLPPLANPFAGLESEPQVRLVTPEDTQTLVDIKVDKENNAPPCFAVQLFWSISPIDVGTLPHLAIFDAYTLYNVEGNRQGRKWYGLRLGFFSDPNSATQVANYVRSDYKAVAVVPVAVKERDRARGGPEAAAPLVQAPRKTTDIEFSREGMEGFELLTDDRPAPAKRDIEDAAGRKAVPAANGVAPKVAAAARPGVPAPRVATAPVPGTATGKPTGKRVVARRRAPQPPPGKTVSAGVGGAEVLESTLEILGASTLSLDEGRQLITDAAARKPEVRKSAGRFSRLLSRLSGG